MELREIRNIKDDYFLGSDDNSILDWICAFLFAMMPLLQHYVGPIKNGGFTLLVIAFPLLAIRFFCKKSIQFNRIVFAIVPFVLFEIYTTIIHGITIVNAGLAGLLVLVYFCIASGSLNLKVFFHTVVFICEAASVIVIVQFILYNIFGYHLRIIPTDLLLPGSDRWMARAIVGISSKGAMYRPSGIFLEPSHMTLYTFPVLSILLLDRKFNKKYLWKAILISLGVVFTTSGMGIVIVAALWGIYLVFYLGNNEEKTILQTIFSKRTAIIVLVFLGAIVGSYFCVPFVRSAIRRVLFNKSGYSVAIGGRVGRAFNLLRKLKFKAIIIGVSKRAVKLGFNMPGFHATLYKWGIIGLLLSYWYYVRGFFKLKGSYFYITAIILVLSFFTAHTHGTFYMLYFSCFLLNGYYNTKETALDKVNFAWIKRKKSEDCENK